ncbi:MAG: Ribosomal large subunit methyltransferase [Betaproteobacteria bacterium]|nr:Ribosomal large subunit methyltransferase [Betaproteobacteria bacterium]
MERKNRGDMKPTRSVSSNRWMHEHVTDQYVQQAKKLGYRSRSAFKILEIDEKVGLFKRGMTVVDLGAAPGGWSQMAAPKIVADVKAEGADAPKSTKKSQKGRVIAVDLLEMPGLPGVEFLQADFSTDEGLAKVEQMLGENHTVDLVMSDMAPNISGIGISDQAKSMYLCELALDFAARFLQPNGAFVVKTFQGVGFTEFFQAMKDTFREVKSIKPKASRDRSTEIYLVGRGRKS